LKRDDKREKWLKGAEEVRFRQLSHLLNAVDRNGLSQPGGRDLESRGEDTLYSPTMDRMVIHSRDPSAFELILAPLAT